MGSDENPKDRPPDSLADGAETPRRIGNYRVIRQLGYGAFADVYLAQHEQTHLQVALKVLRAQLDPRLAEQIRLRFLAEERIARTIDDARIVRIYETSTGEEAGPCFIAMEYVDGKPFCEAFRGFEPLTDEERQLKLSQLGMMVAQAVARAHERGIVHRDLKPDNVLVTRGPRHGIKILDFGIAKAPISLLASLPKPAGSLTSQLVTELGTVMGSRPYMAPEQNGAAHAVTGKADVYALGVMLAITAAGLDADALETSGASWVLQEDVDRVIDTRPLSNEFSQLLRRMLELEPEARPEMAEVALELQRWSRPERAFADAVYAFRKHAKMPTKGALLRVLRDVEHEAHFTEDELEFLRLVPARSLASTGAGLPWALVGLCAASAAALGVTYVRQREQAQSDQAKLRVQNADVLKLYADLKQSVGQPGETGTADARELRLASAAAPKSDAKAQERSAPVCRNNAEQLAECVERRRGAERQAAECSGRSENLAQNLETQRRELDAHVQAEAQCRRELDTRIAQLAECTSRVRLCSESLRATNSVRTVPADPDGAVE
ncbi:MAG TPA: serine/threonine-protein kinase [Polyangiaceae bacterium]|nr:serine/threonine-protein kinase [Polyangiaceae bacterium]